MKKNLIIILCLLIFFSSSCSRIETNSGVNESPKASNSLTVSSTGQIYLHGETHGIEKVLDKEFEIWSEYYNNNDMRHLFVEMPFYTAKYLNLWMQSDSDAILDALYKDWEGSALHNPGIKEFYKKIKKECPMTVFHGTDVGHQYESTGKRYLGYLEDNNMRYANESLRTQDTIEQGKYYYYYNDDVYRENKMTENFVFEFENLYGESVMGIYGSAHTGLEAMDYFTNTVPCMANQLKELYGDAVHSEDLS